MTKVSGSAIALGTFDGIHIGHTTVLKSALGFDDLKPIVVTFNEPPKKYKGEYSPMLISTKEKIKTLQEMGFAEIISLDYLKVCDLSPKEFLDLLLEKYNAKVLVCGFNYRFGKGGEGTAQFLVDYCAKMGLTAIVCPAVEYADATVSSSFIRQLIENGDVGFASKLLGRYFSFKGEVIGGDKRGHALGFPTANVLPDSCLVMPKFAVYATRTVVDGAEYPSVTNIGLRPTFLLDKPLSETHIIGFEGDLYGKTIEIKFVKYLRDETKFDSLENLKETIAKDIEKSKN